MPANRTTFLALCVLAQAQEDARAGAVAPTLGLRLALAYLYDSGDRRGLWFDREPYEDFWRAVTQRSECGGSAAAFGRSQVVTSSINAIARAAGMELDVMMAQRVSAFVTPADRAPNGAG